MKSDLYEILQVSPNAEPEVIDAAYRRLARKYHPDVNPSPDAAARMKEINQAYDILSDPQKRAMYDAQRQSARTSRYEYPPSPRPTRPTYQPPKEPHPRPTTRRMVPLGRPLGAVLAVLALISCVASFLILPGRGFPSFGPTSYPTSTPYPTDTARPAVVLTPTPIGSSMPPTPTETPTPTSTSVSTALPSPSGGQKTYIIVEAGETLATIAEQFDTTVEALIAANGLTSPYVIYVGQELMIPGEGVVLPSPTKPAPPSSPTAPPTATPIPPTPVPYPAWREKMTSAMAQADVWISQIDSQMISNYQEQLSCPLAEEISDSTAPLSVDLYMTEHPDSWNCKRAEEELRWALNGIGATALLVLDHCRYDVSLSVASLSLNDVRETLVSARHYYNMCIAE